VETISPCPTSRSDRDKWGMGVRHALFPKPALGAHPRGGLPASRRHSPRQAELSASWQGRPPFCNARILSEAFQLASAGGCATGPRTRSRHACDFFFRVLTTGSGSAAAFGGAFARSHGSRLLALKLPFAHSPAVSFLTSPALGSFSRNLPSSRGLPDASAPFVRLSAFFAGRSQFYLLPPEPSAPC